MEYIFRALNAYDHLIDPMKYGFVNKKVIDECAYNFYSVILNPLLNDKNMKNISKQEYDQIYQNMKLQIVMSAKGQILSQVKQTKQYIETLINSLIDSESFNHERSIYKIIEILSTLQGHLRPGEKDTEWVSFSKELSSMKKYYLRQSSHAVAVVKSRIVHVFDFLEGQKLIGYDLSTRDKIFENKLLLNKPYYRGESLIYQPTDKTCRNFNYSVSSKEVVYFNYVPSEKVVTVLNPLEVDLALNGVLNLDLYEKSKGYSFHCYQKLLIQLKRYLMELNQYDSRVEYLINEHFKNAIPISQISDSYEEGCRLIATKKKILKSVCQLNNPLIGGKNSNSIDSMET